MTAGPNEIYRPMRCVMGKIEENNSHPDVRKSLLDDPGRS